MVYPIRVRPQVEGEIVEAMAWYERRAPELGLEFYRTYLEVLTRIAENPELYRKVRGDVRRVVLRRFPYAVFYLFDGDEIVIVSCLHEKRSPDRWPDRG
jgi:plasmid stabilization system protein ParE